YRGISAFTIRGSLTHSNQFIGQAGDDYFVGGIGNDTISAAGGDDIADIGKGGATAGETGTDTVDLGQGGNDLLIVDYHLATDKVTFGWGGAFSGNANDG